MPIHKSIYSMDSNEWRTPKWLYDLLDSEFHFELDPAATDYNALAPEYYTKEENGLIQPWAPSIVYVNPPYSPWQTAINWVRKMYEEALAGSTVVALLPARTSNIWFHEYVMLASELRFIRNRLHFEGGKYFAPFPSIVVIWEPGQSAKRPSIGPSISAKMQKYI